VDMLAILINREKREGHINRVMPHVVEGVKNLKLLLCAFEELPGPKINFHKNEIFCFGDAKVMQV
jgi:hypothetical protein